MIAIVGCAVAGLLVWAGIIKAQLKWGSQDIRSPRDNSKYY